MRLITADGTPPSLARVPAPDGPPAAAPLRVALVQHRWREDADELARVLDEAVGQAAQAGAEIVFLPEITVLRYPADVLPTEPPGPGAESLEDGPTVSLARAAATRHGVFVHASLYERAERPDGADPSTPPDGLGYNTAVVVSPDGEVVARTRKTHIPVTAGYHEDRYFRAGPAEDAYPVHDVATSVPLRLGLPTCWDEWFPEVARAYSIGGAQVLCYPTAIGSEPDHPDFDTQPLWQQVIVGNGIANGLFMVVPNRTGDEGVNDFYGSSFISDPYGRVLVQAPRDEEAVLVADLDLAQREDWLALFPFLSTRRPDSYGILTEPVRPEHVRVDPHAVTHGTEVER
ncbi:hydrolase [Janibacter sp. YIM B02568]|uniref:nitrilase-related carbon-nitrogen hydrolase n=1 Tax=Janibacter endophyticus TaxID=2806261 RepID=UPI00194F759B|nr:nitrilase-related carbon-nitrogen hydrolase [Janibacter endophyticus]MBM6546726.1 hydrolase [Janibacter endophyticus]